MFLAASRACPRNAALMMVLVGTPRFSRYSESWIHHDVQPPQSPQALTTASTLPSSSGAIRKHDEKFLRTEWVSMPA